MKRVLSLASLALTAALLTGCGGGSAPAPSGDGNDSVAQATPISIGQNIDGSISGQPRDYDFYSFDATAGDQLQVDVFTNSLIAFSTLDPHVRILMPDGKTVVEKDDDSGRQYESQIRINIPTTGKYFIKVTSYKIYSDEGLDETNTDNVASNLYRLQLKRR